MCLDAYIYIILLYIMKKKMLNFIQKCKSVGVERRLVLYKLIITI